MLSNFFLERPVFAWVIAIVMMLAGGLAIYNLPVSQYPPIAPPSIAISAFYPGASAETVENSVIQIIEQKMTGFDNLLYMSATSDASGAGRIELTFAPGTDPDLAWAQVQNKLQLAMASLPDVVQRQGVKVSKSTRNYLLLVGLTSEGGSMDMVDLADYAKSQIEKVLARVPGVGEVESFGSQYAMRIWLNPDKLIDYRLTVEDVIQGLQAYNVEVSAGQFGGLPAVKGQRLNASIIVQNLLKTPEEFAAIPLRINPDGSIVRVRDVGWTELGTERYETYSLFNGKPASVLAIRKAAGANALKTADAVKAALEDLSRYFPAGMKVVYPYDTTPFVEDYRGAGGDSGNLRGAGIVRILHQHADHVRHGAGHWSSGRRRHRGGGERRTRHERGGTATQRSDSQVHGRNHQRVDRDRTGAFGGVRPHGLLRRFDRRHLSAIFRDRHSRHAAVGSGGADPESSPLRSAPQAGGKGARIRRVRLLFVPAVFPVV